MGKMPKGPTDSLGKSSELKLHYFCLFDAYSIPKDMCSACLNRKTTVHWVSWCCICAKS